MLYQYRLRLCVLLLFTLILAACGGDQPAAQDSTASSAAPAAPLTGLLAMVPASAAIPDEDNVWLDISFADYAAMNAAREGVPAIADWAQYHQLDEAGDGSLALWQANRSRLTSGLDSLGDARMLILGGELMPQVVGFDYFAIDASLAFGYPPQRGYILSGGFDPEAVIAAHADRGYTTQEVNGLTMLCGPVGGCEDPLAIDRTPQERDPETLQVTDENSLAHNANPFGGVLRQQYPLVALPGFILSSQATDMLENMVAAYQDEADSLLGLPGYRAAAEAVTAGDGQLIQARFIHPSAVMYVPSPNELFGSLMASGQASPEVMQALAERYGLDEPLSRWADLPVYELVLLADRQEGTDQIALFALVYANEADAQAGAATLTERVRTFADLRHPEVVFIEQPSVNATLDEPAVYHSEAANRWVAVAAARYAMPGNDPDDAGQILGSGLLYRYWYRAYADRALTLLWTAATPPEE